jgi:hypothetical protein
MRWAEHVARMEEKKMYKLAEGAQSESIGGFKGR